MEQNQSAGQSKNNQQRIVRFANDSNLTFVNYGTKPVGNLTYRREARLHNAQRRLKRSTDQAKERSISDQSMRKLDSTTDQVPGSLLSPVSTLGRDPFHQTSLMSPKDIELVWRSTLPDYFGLPRLEKTSTEFPDPAEVLFSAARASESLYRALVVQPVVTSEAERGNGSNEAVFKNQALILQDFRRHVEVYDAPQARLSSHQFEHIFASAFSLSGHGFGREAGYNAIIFLNSIFMSTPHNRTIIQTLVSEWLRMLMPRPGPDFQRSQMFQSAMLQKVNSVIDFLDAVQSSLHSKFHVHISRYLQETSSIYQIVCTTLPDEISHEPYQGFHLICFHRILSMLLRHLELFNQQHTSEHDQILANIERLASICLQYSPPQRIALFTWCLLANAEAAGLNNDAEEICFSWTMKELISIHDTTFLKEMIAWILHKANTIIIAEIPVLDIDGLRLKMQNFYNMDVDVVNELISRT